MQNQQPPTTIGMATGLLTTCVVTLICIFVGHEPDTVMYRAGLGGTIVGIVTIFAVWLSRDVLNEE